MYRLLVFFVLLSPAATETSTSTVETTTTSPSEKPPKDKDDFCKEVVCAHYASCLSCSYPNCSYGDIVNVNCSAKQFCANQVSVLKKAQCRYCWQLEPKDYDCEPVKNCSTTATHLFRTVCRARQSVICMGRRAFYKRQRCNWSSGHVWWKAMVYSVTLGGFGADRFYLGLWKSAFGKLFSFGGLGVWTIIDVILIGIGYVGPADGSLYI